MAKSKKDGWVNWRKHPAREIILQDFERGGLFYGVPPDTLDIQMIFLMYKTLHKEFFSQIVFDQFEARMRSYMANASERRERSSMEELAMNLDRQRHPQATMNARGELVFDLHPAKELLREDVENKIHEQMTPDELRMTRREYQLFDNDIFKHRIYQEIRYQKYCNHLEDKRRKKRDDYLAEKLKKEKKAEKVETQNLMKAAKEAEKAAEKAAAKEEKRLERELKKAAKEAEKAAAKEEKRLERERMKAAKEAAKEAERAAAKEEKRLERELKKAAKEAEKAAAKEEKRLERERMKAAKEAEKEAERAAAKEEKRLERESKKAATEAQKRQEKKRAAEQQTQMKRRRTGGA